MKPTPRIILPALALGGAIGAAIAFGWLPKAVGVGAAIVVAVATAVAVRRARKSRRR